MTGRSRLYDWGLLLFCNMVWGSQFVVYKIVQRQSGPVFAALFPISIATLLLAPIVVRERRKSKSSEPMAAGVSAETKGLPHAFWHFVLIGVAGQVVTQTFVAWGVRYTLASNAALLGLGLPIFTAIMAYLLLGERMTPPQNPKPQNPKTPMK